MILRRISPKQTGQLKEKNQRQKVDIKAAKAEEERRFKKPGDDEKSKKKKKRKRLNNRKTRIQHQGKNKNGVTVKYLTRNRH